MIRKNIKYIVLFALIGALFKLYGFNFTLGHKGIPVEPTEQDTLDFLVNHSDIIATVLISGGTDEDSPSLFTNYFRKKVDATILTMIKGDKNINNLSISNSPEFQGYFNGVKVIKHIVTLRNGKHLVFLCKSGDVYKPTTGLSLLDISNNRAYPMWHPEQYDHELPGQPGIKFSNGIPVTETIQEIKNEIEKANQKIKRTS